MIQQEKISLHLQRLLIEGHLPNSACSASLRRALRPLFDSGVVASERAAGGKRLVLRNVPAFRDFCRSQFPEASFPPTLGTRTAGVARFRNSKTFASDTPEIVSIRAWSEKALLHKEQPAGAASATVQHGVFSFLLSAAQDYRLQGACALVENPAVFTHFERFQLSARLVIYGHGRASNRLLEWLSTQSALDFQLLHLPDYDPAGLTEFQRLRNRLGSRVRLHVPRDLDQQFARFSNRSLLQKANSQSMLATLRRSTISELCQVVPLIDQHNAGLEQEALLL